MRRNPLLDDAERVVSKVDPELAQYVRPVMITLFEKRGNGPLTLHELNHAIAREGERWQHEGDLEHIAQAVNALVGSQLVSSLKKGELPVFTLSRMGEQIVMGPIPSRLERD